MKKKDEEIKKLKKENLQLRTKIDDSLKTDLIEMSKYKKEIEDCHQRMKAMKDEIASKENSLRIVRDKKMRHLQDLKRVRYCNLKLKANAKLHLLIILGGRLILKNLSRIAK